MNHHAGYLEAQGPAVEPPRLGLTPSKALTLQGYIRFHDKLEAEDQLLKAPNVFTLVLIFAPRSFKSQNDLVETMWHDRFISFHIVSIC